MKGPKPLLCLIVRRHHLLDFPLLTFGFSSGFPIFWEGLCLTGKVERYGLHS